MTANAFATMLADACYAFLTINFFWGLYHLVLGYRRIKQVSFRSHEEQGEFMEEVMPLLQDRNYDAVEELCAEDARAVPQLTHMAVANRDLATTTCGNSLQKSCSVTLWATWSIARGGSLR